MRILFCSRGFPSATQNLAARLPSHELVFCEPGEVIDYVADVDVVVPLMNAIDGEIISRGRFGLIQQFGVGLETVDIEAATQAGVRVARIPSAQSGNADSVAEHAILLMLALSRQLDNARAAFEEKSLGQPAGAALLGKQACIVGLGGIGTAVARRLRAFGMTLVGIHEYPERGAPPDTVFERIVPLADWPAGLGGADYVVACLNYHADRHHLLDGAAFAAMRQGAFFVNVARGGLVDTDALCAALESGHLAGAGLDVYESEPADPAHPLFAQNVIATPHIAGVTDASYDGIARAVADNIERYARGDTLSGLANRPANPR